MPAILVGASQRNEQMWQALKTCIMRDRQRKKQEQEADEEEERLRKKRKYQQKQDVMTLGETVEQITNLQNEVLKLREEKRQLDIELRRVIYEKENRKQQLIKENSINSEMLMVGDYSAINTKVAYPQLLSLTTQGASPLYEPNTDESYILTTGSSKETFSSPSTLSTPMLSTSPIPCHISYYKPLPHISSYNFPSSSKSKEVVRLPSNPQESIIHKDPLLRWIMENSLSLNKRNYDYPLIMPQSSRETSELSEPTYSTEHRTHQSAYVTNVHAMEQCKDSYNEEKQYLQSNQNIIHATTMQQSPQDTKISGITTGFSRSSTVIPYQPSQPHTPAVNEDMSHIILRRLLYNQSYKTPMSYNKYSLYHKTDL